MLSKAPVVASADAFEFVLMVVALFDEVQSLVLSTRRSTNLQIASAFSLGT